MNGYPICKTRVFAHLMEFFFVSIFIIFTLVCSTFVSGLTGDGRALLHFRSSLDEDPKDALSNWNAYDKNPCGWFGIQCQESKVISINLTGLSLKGTIAPELGQLTNLQQLILRGNELIGKIPFQLGELEKLDILDLAFNRLSGELPKDLGNLSSLSELYLDNNELEGNIPFELGDLENLSKLIVNTNRLSGLLSGKSQSSQRPGSIHESGICRLKCLQVANFSSNYFEGDPPMCLQHLPRSSFSFNCLSREGSLYQRPFEDCERSSGSSIARRRLLQSQGSAGTGTQAPGSGSVVISNSSGTSLPSPSSTASPSPSPSVPIVTTAPAPPFSPSQISFPSPSESPTSQSGSSTSSEKKSSPLLVVILVSLGAFLSIVLVVAFLCCRHKGTAVRPWRSNMSGELQKGFSKGVPVFGRMELEVACEDFSNIIGFSTDIVLFKGTLANGVEIAVTSIRKSAKSWSAKSELIFWRKVEILSQMKHENLVNLVGYCAEENPFIRMLVFEYVPNGTVYEHLHNEDAEQLDWDARIRIIMGVANALEYMHHGIASPVKHTKLDSKSVFLSEEYTAKVADFGVWKAPDLQSGPLSSDMKGAGMDEEQLELHERRISHQDTNIYDFGVFLLEMISGRPPNSIIKDFDSLPEWALGYIGEHGDARQILDPALLSYNFTELEAIAAIAHDCLQTNLPTSCNTMREISSRLRSSLVSLKLPIVPRSSPLLWAELEILSQD